MLCVENLAGPLHFCLLWACIRWHSVISEKLFQNSCCEVGGGCYMRGDRMVKATFSLRSLWERSKVIQWSPHEWETKWWKNVYLSRLWNLLVNFICLQSADTWILFVCSQLILEFYLSAVSWSWILFVCSQLPLIRHHSQVYTFQFIALVSCAQVDTDTCMHAFIRVSSVTQNGFTQSL